ncbi:SDR family oxidoreductase [Actinomadura sp. 3N508]|uniref:SDR family oxidoreductase n=1 Tax=Actinomadura sp. 3N508 TaxID=3375153 RepID=UPI0037B7557E
MTAAKPLDGKRALVTGGSRGIGKAVVRRLARDGAQVVFGYRENEDAADALAREVAGTVAVRADQEDLASLDALFERVERVEGVHRGLDVLVNNAAINPPTPIRDITPELFDRVMTVNAKFPLLAMRRAEPLLRDGGRIVNISTLNTVLPMPGLALYSASKAALEQFTAVAAREFGARNITVNTVSPGATDTDLLRDTNPPEALEQTAAFTALGRVGTPEDIADVVAMLAGPDGRWITGQNIRATGGFVL